MTCVKMRAGDHIFDRLYESDPQKAVFFFYVLCVIWYFCDAQHVHFHSHEWI